MLSWTVKTLSVIGAFLIRDVCMFFLKVVDILLLTYLLTYLQGHLFGAKVQIELVHIKENVTHTQT